jgi:hypothetical protein
VKPLEGFDFAGLDELVDTSPARPPLEPRRWRAAEAAADAALAVRVAPGPDIEARNRRAIFKAIGDTIVRFLRLEAAENRRKLIQARYAARRRERMLGPKRDRPADDGAEELLGCGR